MGHDETTYNFQNRFLSLSNGKMCKYDAMAV